ncbi:hypothetical protein ACIZ62_08905 [Acetobacterium carbinolicum]|uniref:hypothetical protein n=1 Tax=Acetobacterium carbinolicum TaxID=52690 RepID=UPI0039BFE97C
MKKWINGYWIIFLLVIIVSAVGYIVLLSTTRTGLVDMCIEGALFLIASIIALRGFSKSKDTMEKNFRRFELLYGLTYLIAVISFIIGIYYYVNNPNIVEISISDVMGNNLLMVMSSIKSFTMVFLIFAWISFYKYLDIKGTSRKKIITFLGGFSLYLAFSIIIGGLTDDISVLSLGVVLGSIIGIFALIALDKRTRCLAIIFAVYSCIHLSEFYLMGIGKNLTTGLNNPVYWAVTLLYILEVKRWIDNELNKE